MTWKEIDETIQHSDRKSIKENEKNETKTKTKKQKKRNWKRKKRIRENWKDFHEIIPNK